jgi:hypothetical protein
LGAAGEDAAMGWDELNPRGARGVNVVQRGMTTAKKKENFPFLFSPIDAARRSRPFTPQRDHHGNTLMLQ